MRIVTRHSLIFLASIFFASLLVRLLFYYVVLDAGQKSFLLVDSEQYLDLARAYASGNLTHPLSFVRLPGYSLLRALTGTYAWLIQLLYASCVPLAVYALVYVLFGCTIIARLAAIVAVVHLGFVMYAGIVSTESLFVLGVVLFFLHFWNALHHDRYWLSAGLLLGIISLIRPVGLYMFAASLSMIIVSSSLRRMIAIGYFSIGWFMIVSCWLLRNMVLTGSLFFHTLPGMHFLQYTAAYVYQDVHHVSYQEARAQLLAQYHDQLDHHANTDQYSIERCRVAEQIAYTYIKEYPLLTIKHSIGHMIKTIIAPQAQLLPYLYQGWQSYDDKVSWRDKVKRLLLPSVNDKLVAIIMMIDAWSHLVMIICSLLWCVMMLRHRLSWPLLGYVITWSTLFIGLTSAYGCARLRLPLEPFMIGMTIYVLLIVVGKIDAKNS